MAVYIAKGKWAQNPTTFQHSPYGEDINCHDTKKKIWFKVKLYEKLINWNAAVAIFSIEMWAWIDKSSKASSARATDDWTEF